MAKWRHTLWFRLTAAFLLVVMIGVSAVAYQANRTTATHFRSFLTQGQTAEWEELADRLKNLYQRQGNWDGAAILLQSMRPAQGQGSGGAGVVLMDDSGREIASVGGRGNRPESAGEADVSLSIVVEGLPVATLLVREPGGGGGRAAEQFLADVNRAIWWGGGISVLLALVLGIWLARRLTRPLQSLTQATRQMAGGDLSTQVPANFQGEMGELAESFNGMASSLAGAERQRQQLLADVAHELRTPLSIMRGHLEAMLDGVFANTPDNLALVHEETLLLGRLVEDLRTLSLAESGSLPLQRRLIDLMPQVTQAVAAFAPLAEAEGVLLQTQLPNQAPGITADPDRLQQVLGNLIANALRHVSLGSAVTPTVHVTVDIHDEWVQISVGDNGPGMPPEHVERVFDRFWRADGSRNRDQGGSGLGLAICRAIVDAHDGRIWAESQPGEGATFFITLPVVTVE